MISHATLGTGNSALFRLGNTNYLNLVPIDNTNQLLIEQLHKIRNTHFEGGSCHVDGSAKRGNMRCIAKMIEERQQSDDFYCFINHSKSPDLDTKDSLISDLIQAISRDEYSGVVEIRVTISLNIDVLKSWKSL